MKQSVEAATCDRWEVCGGGSAVLQACLDAAARLIVAVTHLRLEPRSGSLERSHPERVSARCAIGYLSR